MDNALIQLSGKDTLLTRTQETAYRVRKGTLLVFVVPVERGTGRLLQRRYLCEGTEDFCVPPLQGTFEGTDGREYDWFFLLAPLGRAEVETLPAGGEQREAFLAGVEEQLRNTDPTASFAERMVEFYNLASVRDMRNLYTFEKGSRDAAKRTLEAMGKVLGKDRAVRGKMHPGRTGNLLYDATARLCSWQGITPAPEETIRGCCGKRYSVEDIARVSRFACRRIVLSGDWYRRDAGAFLAFYGEKKTPVACIPERHGHYLIWNPETDTHEAVTKETAEQMLPEGYMLYRPFPAKKIDRRELIRFGLKDLYLRDVAQILLLTLFVSILGLVQTYLNQQLYDVFIPLEDEGSLRAICLVVMCCTMGGLGFSVVRGLANFRGITRMKYSVQAAVMDRLFNLPESFFRDYDSADLAARAKNVPATFELLAQTAVGSWLSGVFSILYLWRMLVYSPRLTAVCVVLLGFVLLFMGILGGLQLRMEKERLESDSRISSFLNQIILGIQKIRTTGAQERVTERYMELYTRNQVISRKSSAYSRAASLAGSVSTTLFSIALFWMVIQDGVLKSVGTYMGFVTAFGAFSAAMVAVLDSILTINRMLPSLERMKPILETLPELQEGDIIPGKLEGNISIEHVSFRYRENAPYVLKDLSMEIRAGEYIGIVGPSGCGKSTLLKLLLGFEKAESGKIFYDSHDLDRLDKRQLRKCFGTVLQDGGLIPGSIAENISITCPSAGKSDIEAAVEAAGLTEDVARMPMGMFTMLSEGDGAISGGQKQRILIARAIIGKPSILFLDEATSALDNNTQRMVCESLEKLGGTRVVIAHRLSTIMHCDRIYVLRDGAVAECGTYEELMAQKGFFYELASRQIA